MTYEEWCEYRRGHAETIMSPEKERALWELGEQMEKNGVEVVSCSVCNTTYTKSAGETCDCDAGNNPVRNTDVESQINDLWMQNRSLYRSFSQLHHDVADMSEVMVGLVSLLQPVLEQTEPTEPTGATVPRMSWGESSGLSELADAVWVLKHLRDEADDPFPVNVVESLGAERLDEIITYLHAEIQKKEST